MIEKIRIENFKNFRLLAFYFFKRLSLSFLLPFQGIFRPRSNAIIHTSFTWKGNQFASIGQSLKQHIIYLDHFAIQQLTNRFQRHFTHV